MAAAADRRFSTPLMASMEPPLIAETASEPHCLLPALIYPTAAVSAGIGRVLNAFGSLESINGSLATLLRLILPFASPEVQIVLAAIVGGAFCAGNALMSSMSEVGKILETHPAKDDHSSKTTPYQQLVAWSLAAANGITTAASAFNGLKILFSNILGEGLGTDILGGYFALAVFASSSYFNTKKDLKFAKMDIPDLRDSSLWLKYIATSVIAMVTSGAMTAYQVSTLLSALAGTALAAGVAIPAWITITALILAVASDANLYYTQIPATKETFAKAEATMISQRIEDLQKNWARINPADQACLAEYFGDDFERREHECDSDSADSEDEDDSDSKTSEPNLVEKYRHITSEQILDLQIIWAKLPQSGCCECTTARTLCQDISKFCHDMGDAPISTLLKGIGHMLIDAAWVLTPMNTPDTLKTLIELCCNIIAELGKITDGCDWISTDTAAYGILAGGILLGLPAAVMAKSYRRDDAYKEFDALIDGMFSSGCCSRNSATAPHLTDDYKERGSDHPHLTWFSSAGGSMEESSATAGYYDSIPGAANLV